MRKSIIANLLNRWFEERTTRCYYLLTLRIPPEPVVPTLPSLPVETASVEELSFADEVFPNLAKRDCAARLP